MAAERAIGPRGQLGYRPGLDGLRALAVAAVVSYHLGAGWAAGGWLGVSLFFTLSGFLITSLLLAEHDATGRIHLGAFWARRARRLLPAAIVAIALAVAVATMTGGSAGLAGDVRAAVAYVANWRFIAHGTSYADAFAEPSPVQHLWSLAIEEQFYVVFPVLALAALAGRRGGRRRLGLAVAVVAAGSLLAQLAVTGVNRRYFGTDTRAAELAIGALAAVAAWPRLRAGRAVARPVVLGLVGVAALAVTGVLWATATLRWAVWARGGFTAVGALSGLAVLAATSGPVARALGWRPLVWLGQRSYGVYLYHWPVLLALTPARTGWDGPVLVLARLGATAALAGLSFRYLELPVRQRRWLVHPRRALPAALGALGAMLLITVPLTAAAQPSFADRLVPAAPSVASPSLPLAHSWLSCTQNCVNGPEARPPGAPPAPPLAHSWLSCNQYCANGPEEPPERAAPAALATAALAPTTPAPLPTLWLIGDSVPHLLGVELAPRAGDLGARVINLGLPSCDGARGRPRMRLAIGDPFAEPSACGDWPATWAATAEAAPPDRVVAMLGATAVVDRDFDGTWRNPCDAEFRAWYEPEVLARVDWLSAHTDATVALATTPWSDDSARFIALDRDARTDCLNDIYRAVAAARPGVELIDLAGWVCPGGPGQCRTLRDDGLHFSADHAVEVGAYLFAGTV